jgi:predicted N-acetyltransferase YhbS
MQIKYSKAKLEDLDGIVRLSLILNFDEPAKDKVRLREWAERAIQNGMAWVAKNTGNIVGFAYCDYDGPEHRYFPNSIFIAELFVDDKYRRQGIGKELLKLVFNNKYPKEYTYFSITHDPKENWLTNYYSSFGFVKTGTTDVGNIKLTKDIELF